LERKKPVNLLSRIALCNLLSVLLISSIPLPAFASIPRLSQAERASLRYKLENLFNEVDLLIRNQRVDEADVLRQEREMEALKVYERIPFTDDLEGLKEQLSESARQSGVKLERLLVLGRSKAKRRIPSSLLTDEPEFRLTPLDVVETLHLQLDARGSESAIQRWTSAWQTEQLRLVEPAVDAPERQGVDRWQIQARTFRFRNIQFPALRPRPPEQLLPAWARRNSSEFARQEPLLWSFVEKVRALTPAALPLYRNRERFLLNGARMDFFLAKAMPRSQTR